MLYFYVLNMLPQKKKEKIFELDIKYLSFYFIIKNNEVKDLNLSFFYSQKIMRCNSHTLLKYILIFLFL